MFVSTSVHLQHAGNRRWFDRETLLHMLQGRLDALEQRMLSKMDRALAKFLEKQLGTLLD